MGCLAPGLSSSTGFPASFYGCSSIRANSPSPAVELCWYLGVTFARELILWGEKLGEGWDRCDSAHAAATSKGRGTKKWGPHLQGCASSFGTGQWDADVSLG